MEEDTPPPGHFFMSASQLKTWWSCNRKWGFQYILKLRAPSGRGAALGSIVHRQLERYLKDQSPLDFTEKNEDGVYPAEIAATGLQYLPTPGTPGLMVERKFKFSDPGAPHIVFRGAKDFELHGLIGDHKTCGSWQYALTADDLQGDVQAIMYAQEFFQTHPTYDTVDLLWVYYGTKKKYSAKPVTVTLTREHVSHLFPEIVLGASEAITTLQSGRQPLELQANSEECDKYGGCAFKANCNLSPKERRPLRMTSPLTPTANLIERMNAKKAAAGITTSSPPPAASGLSPIAARIAAAKLKAGGETQAAPATSMYAPGCEPEAPPTEIIPARFLSPAVVPALPESDQPINCPSDFQPPPAVADQAPSVAQEVADLTPAPKAKGRPVGSKNSKSATDELLVEVLTLAKAWLLAQTGRAS